MYAKSQCLAVTLYCDLCWGWTAPAAKALWTEASTTVYFCTANTPVAATACQQQLSAAASSVMAVTRAGMVWLARACFAAKMYCRAVTSWCCKCWAGIAAVAVWLCTSAQAVFRWLSASADATSRYATAGMAGLMSSWLVLSRWWRTCTHHSYRRIVWMSALSSLAWSRVFAVFCILGSTIGAAAKACCKCLSAAAPAVLVAATASVATFMRVWSLVTLVWGAAIHCWVHCWGRGATTAAWIQSIAAHATRRVAPKMRVAIAVARTCLSATVCWALVRAGSAFSSAQQWWDIASTQAVVLRYRLGQNAVVHLFHQTLSLMGQAVVEAWHHSTFPTKLLLVGVHIFLLACGPGVPTTCWAVAAYVVPTAWQLLPTILFSLVTWIVTRDLIFMVTSLSSTTPSQSSTLVQGSQVRSHVQKTS